MSNLYVVALLTILTKHVICKGISDCTDITLKKTTDSTKALLKSYERSLNTSLELEKSDESRLNCWGEQFQLTLVNLTATSRILMIRHKENYFDDNYEAKWTTRCLHGLKNDIRRTEDDYYDKETECLKNAMKADREKRLAVDQIQKEIKKWRKSYRHLSSVCNRDNPGDVHSAGVCLIDYIEKDNYSEVLKRLMKLKSEAMEELHVLLNDSTTELENCLKNCLSEYLNTVGSYMVIWCLKTAN